MGLLQISNREVVVQALRETQLVSTTLRSLMQKKVLVLSLGVMVAQQTLALLVLVRPKEGQRIAIGAVERC